MASFSVVSNISAVNAQANLSTTNIGLQQGADAPVERLPHQQRRATTRPASPWPTPTARTWPS